MIEVNDSYIHAVAIGLHDRWITTHKELREVSDPRWRTVLIDDLKEIYAQAKALDSYDYEFNLVDAAALKHILARSIKSHIAILSAK